VSNLPTTRFLFLDTNALVKLFVGERGHDVLMWLEEPEATIVFAVQVMTSVHVVNEFPNTVEKMVSSGQISEGEALTVLMRSDGYIGEHFPGLDIVDTGPLPVLSDEQATSLDRLILKYDLQERDRTDCAIMASIVNYLPYLGGGSTPQVMTSDRKFQKVIRGEGFGVIDPEKTTIDELKAYLMSLG